MKKKIKMAADVLTAAIKQKIMRRLYNHLPYLVFKQKNVITPATHIPTGKTVLPIKKLF